MDDLVKELRAFGANGYMLRAAAEIERLTRERDELRREVCEEATQGETIGAAFLYAKYRGWDCFKENTDVKV